MTKSKLVQRLETTILSNLIYNEDYARKVIPFIKEEYFQDGIEKVIFKTIWQYADQYKSAATISALAIELQKATLNDEHYKTALEYLESLEKDEVDNVFILNENSTILRKLSSESEISKVLNFIKKAEGFASNIGYIQNK